MKESAFQRYFDRLTNLAIILIASILLVSFVKFQFTQPETNSHRDSLKKGTILGEIQGAKLHESPRTLLLALSTHCRYCTQSLPFYKDLVRRLNAASRPSTKIVALFSESQDQVKEYTTLHEFSVASISDVDFLSLGIPATPALILVDRNSEVLNSWVGKVSKDEEKDVHGAIDSHKTHSPESSIPDKTTTPTVVLFNDKNHILHIRPRLSSDVIDTKSNSLPALRRQVNYLDVDNRGHIFIELLGKILEYGQQGQMLNVVSPPEGFGGPFCLDHRSRIILHSKNGLKGYSASKDSQILVPLPNLPYSSRSIPIKMVCNNTDDDVYIQVFDPDSVEQVLIRINLLTQQAKAIHKQKRQVKFTPLYAPGAFDFAIAHNYIYVSDIYQYRISVYSLQTGSYLREIRTLFTPKDIKDEDGILTNRKMRVGSLIGPGLLSHYPPILHLNVTTKGYLVVWTSERDRFQRQKVDIYDSNLKFIGSDFKYAHPSISTYRFAHNRVYVPDFGFGISIASEPISPLDVPSKALGLKVFEDLMQ